MLKLSAVFCLVFLLFFAVFFDHAKAEQEDIYTISNVATSALAKSAGDAKIIATNNARRDAFTTLLARLSISAAIANDANDDEIFDMVLSERIFNEKIAGNNYIASFDISFAKSSVTQFLENKSVKKFDKISDLYLLIPIKIIQQKDQFNNNQKFSFWENKNDWKAAVEKTLTGKNIKNFIIPENDLSNISIINQDNAENLEYSDLEPLFSRYKVVGAYLMFFYFDEKQNKVKISVKTVKKLQKKQTNLSFVNINRLSEEALIKKVSDKTIEYLLSSQSDNSNNSNSIKLEVKIDSLGNWNMMKNKIESSNLISKMNVEAISKDYVRIAVDYVGSDPDVISSFAKFGLSLSKKSDNFYSVALPTFLNLNISGQ